MIDKTKCAHTVHSLINCVVAFDCQISRFNGACYNEIKCLNKNAE